MIKRPISLIGGLLLISRILMCSTLPIGVSSISSNIYIPTDCATSIASGACESANILLLGEAANYTLTRPVGIDFNQPGTYTTDPTAKNLLSLPTGSTVFSYFLQFDPVGEPATSVQPNNADPSLGAGWAEIVFSPAYTIVGIQTLSGTLKSSTKNFDSTQLQIPGLTYDTADAPGLELGTGRTGDEVIIVDPHTVLFKMDVNGNNVDGFRILVEAPEPGLMALTGLGLLGIGVLTRKRVRR